MSGETYRYQVYVPSGYTRTQSWPVILFLHGAGEQGLDGLLQTEVGLGSAIRRYADRYPAIVVFPQTRPDAAWAGTMADVAMKALEATEREFATDNSRVYLTGLSRGGSGTWYLAYRNPTRFAALLVVCGRIRPAPTTTDPVVPAADGEPFSTLAAKLKDLPIWVFHGDADQTVPVDESRGVTTALKELGSAVRYSELPGVGHNAWDTAYRSPEVPTWLFAQRRAH
jgi:predicted peptidase